MTDCETFETAISVITIIFLIVCAFRDVNGRVNAQIRSLKKIEKLLDHNFGLAQEYFQTIEERISKLEQAALPATNAKPKKRVKRKVVKRGRT